MKLIIKLEDKAFRDIELVGLVLLQLDEAWKDLDFIINEDKDKITCSSEKHGNWLDGLNKEELQWIGWLLDNQCQLAVMQYMGEKKFFAIKRFFFFATVVLTPFIILAFYLIIRSKNG